MALVRGTRDAWIFKALQSKHTELVTAFVN